MSLSIEYISNIPYSPASTTKESVSATITVADVGSAFIGSYDAVAEAKSYYGNQCIFKEWNTSADGTGTTYAAGDVLSSSVTIYAIWQADTVKPETLDFVTPGTLYQLNILTDAERTKISNAVTDISGKVDKNQGTQNAGKALGIGSDGLVTPVAFSGEDFTGATASSDGVHGYVPAPLTGDQTKVLMGDGTWSADIPNRLAAVENVYTDTDVTIAPADWTAGNDSYTYTWQSTLVTSGCGVEVFLRDGADGAGISGFDYSKVAGGVQFITNEQPSGNLPVTIRLINTKSDGLLTLNADEVLSEAITGCDTVEEALTDLDDRVDSLDDNKVNKTDIVNNLTTNDTTKVLSAAQGYALNSKVATKIVEYTNTDMSTSTGSVLSSSILRYVYSPKFIFIYYKIRMQDTNGRPTITVPVPSDIQSVAFSGNGSVTQMRIGTTNYITDVSGFFHTANSNTMTIAMENFLGDVPAGSGWLVISGANMYSANL